MKYFLSLSATLIAITLTLQGCATQPTTTTPKLEVIPGTVVSVPDKPVESTKKIPLAWGPDHPEWDKALREEIGKIPAVDVVIPCKKLKANECVSQMMSKMAQYESSFNPKSVYHEPPPLGVDSIGLFQLSIESEKSLCGLTSKEQLKDPIINIKCAVKVMAKWASKDKTLFAQSECLKNGKKSICYFGGARYWSVLRQKSGSYPKIMKYMEQF